MNVQPITISEFRKNTKLILDQAKDRTIYLARGWEVYRLELVGDATLSVKSELGEKLATHPPALSGENKRLVEKLIHTSKPSLGSAELPSSAPESVLNVPGITTADKIPPRVNPVFCKHGANPKFCKFAKNGKPCK